MAAGVAAGERHRRREVLGYGPGRAAATGRFPVASGHAGAECVWLSAARSPWASLVASPVAKKCM